MPPNDQPPHLVIVRAETTLVSVASGNGVTSGLDPQRIAREFPAAAPVSSGKVVRIGEDGQVHVFEPEMDAPGAIGVTATGVSAAGAAVLVVFAGVVSGLGAASGRRYFAGPSGNPTQTRPSAGILQHVGTGLPGGRLLVDIGQPIILF